MKINRTLLFSFLLVSLFLKGNADLPSIVTFSNSRSSVLIGRKVEILKDETNKLTFPDILNHPGFKVSSEEVPNLGVSPNTFWIRFTIQNHSDQEALLLDLAQPSINEIQFYTLEGSQWKVLVSGDNYPFVMRQYQHPNFIFVLKQKINETKTYYLKVKSDEQILLPLKLGERTVIVEELHNRDLIFGTYVGIMLAMLFYNLFIYFSVRDHIYLRYVIYILFIGLTQACILGYPFQYLWPNSPYFANISTDIFSCCLGIIALEFLKPFLHTKQFAPRLHKFSFVISGLYLLGAVVTFSGAMNLAYNMIQGNALLVAIYMLITSIVISKRGYKPAIFFLVAWSAMLVGIIIYVLKDFGALPTNALTSFTMPIGSALETILLAIALADRINSLKKEKEQSQAQALLVSQQNQKLITEQNIILEQKVHERTVELEETNEELNVTLTYLKDTQTQLVNAEKMASLGQLTAGIAHEINNPINFVSANLKPLKMDISELFEVVSKYETISPDSELVAKLKEIDAFKKEIDLTYIKKEIDTLLAGIEDGATRTAEIVSGLRNFSRLDESDIKEANINEGIESTLILLRSQIQNLEVQLDLGRIPSIECYPGKLNQVFMNVMSNAIYALQKKTTAGDKKLIISTFEKDNMIYAIFKDTGVGMSKEVKEKIFEPFFTTKDVGEGTGLGMSIVFKIVESHQAKMEIESEIGKGTTVTLILKKKISI
ncbi:MAG: 7TM diverse intracellular signaling domain-containing protein [bacterium]|nr:7TM diverse intracellular signaling domain-containing protein [bacterium]